LTALIGPSGSGKTTLLNLIAGVLRPSRGTLVLDNEAVVDTARRVWQPPHKRRIGYVFQEPRLFPHLTVRRNLLYGRWFHRHIPGGVASDDVIGLLNLERLLARRPAELSGGEKQRVALGRALLARPRLLLFDEPLASIDQAHREEILPYLDRIRTEHSLPTVYVTHTWTEIAGRADDVVELSNGRTLFAGPLADHPRRKQEQAGAGRPGGP
jgi:molybdate transport system ATP-binding protein